LNQRLYQTIVVERAHRANRRQVADVAEQYASLGLSPIERMTRRFEWLCGEEIPTFLPGEKICFLRTIKSIPDAFTEAEWEEIRKKHFIHELGYQSNLTVNYAKILKNGLLWLREHADEYGKRAIDALMCLVARYRSAAKEKGLQDIADVLKQVPAYGARNFREALQSMRILNYALWLEGNYHNTIGRFDQYVFPYLQNDLDSGALT